MKTLLFLMLIAWVHLGIANRLLAQEPAKKQSVKNDRFPGFMSELRAADLVVKVTLTGSNLAADTATINGTIAAVYQGEAKPKQAIQFKVDRAALTAKQKRYGDLGHLFYFYDSPYAKDATSIFLIKAGKPFQATAILAESELIAEYVTVARLPDADATAGLVRLLCRLAYDKKTAGWYPYDYPHLLLQDLSVNFKNLNTRSDAFRALLADHRKDAMRALEKSAGFAFQLAVWLTAHMGNEPRRSALAVLLSRHEGNEKLIANLEKEAKHAVEAAKQPGGGIYIDPLTQHLGMRGVYLSAMHLLLNPDWTRDIPQTLYDVLPAQRFFNNKLKAADVLKAARALTQ